MPLKPVFDKSPLTLLTALPLRAGQARPESEKMKRLYRLVRDSQEVSMFEGVFRLACLVTGKAENEPVTAVIRAKLDSQKEDGSFPMVLEEQIALMRAAWAMYEFEVRKPLLEKIVKWVAWSAKNWADVLEDEQVWKSPADLLELLENLYRVTGKGAFLPLMEQLSGASMNWAGALMTQTAQRPMSREYTREEIERGLEKENGDRAGYFTNQVLIGSAEALADGMRAAMAKGWFSGSATEMGAARFGWERLSRHHGAVCGGLTADELLGGMNPSAPVSTAGVGALAEALCKAAMGRQTDWAWEALERLVFNALPVCVGGKCVKAWQRVNTLDQADDRGCFFPGEDQQGRARARLCRGYAWAMQSAVTLWEDGFAVNMMMPGKYAVSVRDVAGVLVIEGGEGNFSLTLRLKEEMKGTFRLRIPDWTPNCDVMVNGASTMSATCRLVDGFISLDRVWHDGDSITVHFDMTPRRAQGYHQGGYITMGPRVMALKAQGKWAYALVGEPKMSGKDVLAPFKPVEGWKANGNAPADLPVLPRTAGETEMLPLVPYADVQERIALFPQGGQA